MCCPERARVRWKRPSPFPIPLAFSYWYHVPSRIWLRKVPANWPWLQRSYSRYYAKNVSHETYLLPLLGNRSCSVIKTMFPEKIVDYYVSDYERVVIWFEFPRIRIAKYKWIRNLENMAVGLWMYFVGEIGHERSNIVLIWLFIRKRSLLSIHTRTFVYTQKPERK